MQEPESFPKAGNIWDCVYGTFKENHLVRIMDQFYLNILISSIIIPGKNIVKIRKRYIFCQFVQP